MNTKAYDAIVVGARCAGSPVAMLLARKGYKVLVVDKAAFPSDTISTHLVHPPGVALLKRWGLLDRVTATGCPPVHTYTFDFGPILLAGSPATSESPVGYSPRRTVLDKLLVDAASEAGAEVREEFTVEEVLFEEGRVVGIRGHGKNGDRVTERSTVVVGADGRHSIVARAVGAESYHEKPAALSAYYSYWSGLPVDGRFEVYSRPSRGFAAWPTNDGLTLVVGGWPMSEFEANRKEFERHFLEMLELAPDFAERVRAGKREERFSGTSVPNYFRKPFGPGWVLAGDAGYNRDFITAFGMTDAFRQADRCAAALDQSLSGKRPFEDVMTEFQTERDQHSLPRYEFTYQIACLEPPSPEMQQLFGAIQGNQEAMDAFARVNGYELSPAEFFAPENLGRIFAASGGQRVKT